MFNFDNNLCNTACGVNDTINTNSCVTPVGLTICLSLSTSIDAKGAYKIVKRLQRTAHRADCPTSEFKREIIDLEIVGIQGAAPAVTLNGLALSTDQCIFGIDGVLTVLDVEKQIVDRIALPVKGMNSVTPSTVHGIGNGALLSTNMLKLGFVVVSLPSDLATFLKLDPTVAVLVKTVVPGSPAQTAGIEAGDVIIAVNGGVASIKQIASIANTLCGGEVVRFNVWRSSTQRVIDVTARKLFPTAPAYCAGQTTGSFNGLTENANALLNMQVGQVLQGVGPLFRQLFTNNVPQAY